MNNTFRLGIYEPYKTIFEGDALMLSVPGEAGYLQLLKNHAPIVVSLGKGKITFRDYSGLMRSFDIAGKGVLEFLNNQATLLLSDEL
ncbi:MAG: hypothetical protein M0Q96_00465 [Candidatus Omnitrophica bacterium]|jgi:F-type H+-transporting ATPase subunit epsilon|nr:hypothetical protein [Candidatus Omnitrophota bacterium]